MPTKSEIQFIKSLSQKKLRDERGIFVAEGPKVVEEFLQAPNIQAQEIYATAEWLLRHGKLAKASGAGVTEIPEQILSRISSLSTPNQVVAIFSKPTFDLTPRFKGKLSLLLDGIQDPGNIGTIIRCADWFAVPHVICGPNCADAFNPKVVQSTMGSLGRVQVLYEDLLSFTGNHNDIPIYATALAGVSLYNQPPIDEGFLLIGNESKGVDEVLLDRAAHRLTIPRLGGAESLNAAVAAAICLSHLTSPLHDAEYDTREQKYRK